VSGEWRLSCQWLVAASCQWLGSGCQLHDISTEVFGRAYLAVRAGYFTH
jgi:hypothetical protein